MMTRRNIIALAVVAWMQLCMHKNVLAFQPLPFSKRSAPIIGGRHNSLSVQSTETPPEQQQDNDDNDNDASDTAASLPHFAASQGYEVLQTETKAETEEKTASLETAVDDNNDDDTPETNTPAVPPPVLESALDEDDSASEAVQPETQAVPPPQPSLVVDTTFDDAVAKPIAKPPAVPPPPSMFEPEPSAVQAVFESIRDATVAGSKALFEPTGEGRPSAAQDLLESVRDATVAGSMSLLKGIRYGATIALTESLPDQEKSQLLSRIKPMDDEAETEINQDDEEEARGSIQEEIALAVREEARQNEQQWQKEKEEITKKLEAAAEARIQSELEIQQMRMEKEKETWKEENKAANSNTVTDLQQKIDGLEEQLHQSMEAKTKLEEESSKAIQEATEKAKQEQDEMNFEANGKDDVEAMLKKRKQQQAMLEQVEKDLREKARQIKADKEELMKLEKQSQESQSSPEAEESDDVPYLSPKEYRSLSQEEKAEIKAKREAAGFKKPDAPGHPVLGPVVADLGYKRIHLVSSGKLGTIPIWNRQRTYRNDRARKMASDKQASMDLGFPGIVCLYEDSEGGLSILDGQHRVGMMQTLREFRNKRGEDAQDDDEALFENVLVEVYSDAKESNGTASGKEKSIAEQVFLEINKAEPVKMLDMPGVASADDRKLITEAVAALKEQFPKMFSTSQRCKSPNVNIDNLRNSIYGANILQRHKDEVATASQLLDWLLIQNAAVGASYENDPKKQQFISLKAWKKASKNGFYLGLESGWLFS